MLRTMGLCLLLVAPVAGEELEFNWRVPCTIRVREESEQKRGTAVTQYDIAVSRAEDGTSLRIDYGNFEFLEVNGVDATTPAMKAEVAKAIPLVSLIPTLLVSPEGAAQEVIGVEEMVDKLLTLQLEEEGASGDEKEARRMREWMQSPAMIAQLKSKVCDPWNTWVGVWLGLDLAAGETAEGTMAVPLPGGGVAEVPIKYENHGAAKEDPALVDLSAAIRLESDVLTAALRDMVKGMAKDLAPGKEGPPEDFYEEAHRDTRFQVLTDPKTLRPRQASSVTEFTLKCKGKDAVTQRESHRYTFDWEPAAEGK